MSMWEMSEEEFVELKKENAKLKEKLGDAQMKKAGEKSDLVWKLKTANEQKAEQLTKAKNIIRQLCSMVRELNNPNVQLTNVDYSLSEAEQFQFLKELENDEQIENLNIQEDAQDVIEKIKEDVKDAIEELKLKIEKLKDRNSELAGQKASLERWFGEAKEIIRKYYKYNPSCEYSYEDICKQAELFLEEVK